MQSEIAILLIALATLWLGRQQQVAAFTAMPAATATISGLHNRRRTVIVAMSSKEPNDIERRSKQTFAVTTVATAYLLANIITADAAMAQSSSSQMMDLPGGSTQVIAPVVVSPFGGGFGGLGLSPFGGFPFGGLGFGFRVTGTSQQVGVDKSLEESKKVLEATKEKQAQLEEQIKSLEEQQKDVSQAGGTIAPKKY